MGRLAPIAERLVLARWNVSDRFQESLRVLPRYPVEDCNLDTLELMPRPLASKLRLEAAQAEWLVTNLPPKSQSGTPAIPKCPIRCGGPSRTRTLDPLTKSRAEEPRTDRHDEVSREASEASS